MHASGAIGIAHRAGTSTRTAGGICERAFFRVEGQYQALNTAVLTTLRNNGKALSDYQRVTLLAHELGT
jgi:hypothetical protein